jgi:class 3 adenylate cyclase/DNA-binding CsgD family transcriptional regulator
MASGLRAFLFTDLVGSTELLHDVGHDGMERLRKAHFELVRRALAANNGDEVKTIGDAFMVAFTSAVDALKCAQAIQQGQARANQRSGKALAVRAGLSAGEATEEDGDYFGVAVIEASRLCAEAGGGQVLISDVARSMTPAGKFSFRRVGALALKGLPEPLAASELVYEVEPVLVTSPSFLGRSAELKTLEQALDRALDGEGRIALIAGDAGIGKTRLSEELAAITATRGAQVLWGRCWEGEGASAFWPWVQVIRSYAQGHDPETLAPQLGPGAPDIVALVPELAEQLAPMPLAPSLEGEAARFRLFDSLTRFLKSAAADRPLLLILEDVHWADQPSLLLLQFLAGEIGESRLMVAATYRDVEVGRGQPLAAALADLTRREACLRLALAGLSMGDSAQLLEQSVGTAPPDESLAALHLETEGNPLFLKEYGRLLAAEGGVRPAGRWELPPKVPETVSAVILRRVEHLSADAVQALTAGSVLGRDFTLSAVQAVSELPRSRLLDALDEAEAARLIVTSETSPGRYTFSHALVRQTLYGSLTGTRRVRLHGQAADVLERLYAGETEGRLPELAHHFFQAAAGGASAKAASYARLAGDQALAVHAYEEAISHYDRALASLAPNDRGTSADVLAGLGRAQAVALPRERLDEAVATLSRACDYYVELGEFEKAASAALLPFYPLWGEPSGMAALLLGLLPRVRPGSALAARMLSRYGRLMAIEQGDMPAANAALDEAIAIAMAGNDPALKLRVLADAANAELAGGDWEKGVNLAKDALAHSDLVEDPLAELDARYSGVQHAFGAGDLTAIERLGAAMLALSEKLRDRFWLAFAYRVRAYTPLLQGDLESAREANDFALSALPDEARNLVVGVEIAYEAGDAAQVALHMDRLLHLIEGQGQGTLLARVYVLLTTGALSSLQPDGREAVAVRHLSRFPFPATLRLGSTYLQYHAGLGMLAVADSDPGSAREHYAALNRGRNEVYAFTTLSSARLLGLLARTLGDQALATRHFEEGLAFCEERGLQLELGWTCHDFASLLLESSEPADLDRGHDLLARALTLSEQLGLRTLYERASTLAAAVASRPLPKPNMFPDGLTAREVEVLRMIANGESNAEIAVHLALSVKTIERHISNIYGKINARGRADATAYTLRHDL